MRTLFYFYTLSGHNIEYFGHLYKAAQEHKDRISIFVVPKNEWLVDSSEFKDTDNIIIDYFDSQDILGNALERYSKSYKLLRGLIKKHKPSDVYFEYLMQNIFAMFLMSFKSVNFHGIIYKIFLRENSSRFTGKLQYLIFATTRSLKSAYILNDQNSAVALNKMYASKKFKFLPDPIQEKFDDLACEDDYSKNPIKIVHLGALSKRKGVLEILKLALKLHQEGCDKFHFVIGGKVDKEILEEFNIYAEQLKQSPIVTFKLGFLAYEDFHQYIADSHFVLIPYQKIAQSSGLIGFGALYSRPLLYPKYGLIEEICDSYKLGFALKGVDCESMYDFLMGNNMEDLWNSYKLSNKSEEYCNQNSIKSFQQCIFNNFTTK